MLREEDDGDEDNGDDEEQRRAEGEEEELEECDDEDKKMESKNLRHRVKELEAREAVRELCEATGVNPSKSLLKALCVLEGADRKALIEEVKKTAPTAPGKNGNKPRTQAITEGRGAPVPGLPAMSEIKDGKDFAALLRNGRLAATN